MGIFSRKNPKLVNRIRKIDKELTSLKGGMRALSKQIDGHGEDVVRRYTASQSGDGAMDMKSAGKTSPDYSQNEEWTPDTQENGFDPLASGSHGRHSQQPQGELNFEGSAAVDRADSRETAAGGMSRQAQTRQGRPGKTSAHEDERFASYFMSGSLGHPEPLRGERHVQRNRAIVLIILFLVMSYALIRAVFVK